YVNGAFAELLVPLKNLNDRQKLELSFAARYERYSDFGDTFNPKWRVKWAPSESFRLRGSWGTSFKAPQLVDLYDVSQNGNFVFTFQDPRSPTGQSVVLVRQGSNPDLNEETSSTLTAGFDVSYPDSGLTLSV